MIVAVAYTRLPAALQQHSPMPRIVIQWQDQFGRWQRYSEKHNQADAFRTAQARARSTGKRHRLVDEGGRLLDLLEP
jgi:hypothetical protein